MNDYEIIDAHCHLFRTLEQEKNILVVPGRRDCNRWATPERAIAFMDQNEISKLVFLNLLPTQQMMEVERQKLPAGLSASEREKEEERIKEKLASRLQHFNEWACAVSKEYPRLIPFIQLEKTLGVQGMVEEISIRASQGARGVKLHPGSSHFFPNDPDLWPVYKRCVELNMPIIADSGLYGGAPEGVEYGQPKHFAEVLADFPQLTLVLAHLGEVFWDERVELSQHYPNVYFDTTRGFSAPDRVSEHPGRDLVETDAVRIIRKVGVERVMFGSDSYYISDPVLQIEQILRLDLSEDEKRMILAENAKRILGI